MDVFDFHKMSEVFDRHIFQCQCFWSGLPGYQSRVLESGDVQMSGLGDCVLVLKMCDGRRKQQCILLFCRHVSRNDHR